jgi:hypothetical protein
MKRPSPLTRHTVLKRSSAPMVRTTRLKPRKSNRGVSDGQLGVDPALRAAVIARDGGCLLRGEGDCWGRLDPHHVLRKRDGGEDSMENLICLCRAHHGRVHHLPWWARERGLLR